MWQASIIKRNCFYNAVVSCLGDLVDYALYASRQLCGTLFGGYFVVHHLRCFVFDREVRDSRDFRHLGSSKYASSPRPIIHVSFVFRVFVWIFGEFLFDLRIFVRLFRVGDFGRSLSSLIIVKPSTSCLRASLGVHYLRCPCFGLSGTTHLVWDLTPILFVCVLSRFGKYPPSCPPF